MARIDVSNRVFTNVKTYINDVCKNVSSGEDKSKAKFPAVSVIQIDNPDSCIDLENSENAVKSVIEIQCYSSDSITELYLSRIQQRIAKSEVHTEQKRLMKSVKQSIMSMRINWFP